jgi:hypothetical protein
MAILFQADADSAAAPAGPQGKDIWASRGCDCLSREISNKHVAFGARLAALSNITVQASLLRCFLVIAAPESPVSALPLPAAPAD